MNILLTDEEIEAIRKPMNYPHKVGEYGLQDVCKAIAQAQLRKVVGWLHNVPTSTQALNTKVIKRSAEEAYTILDKALGKDKQVT